MVFSHSALFERASAGGAGLSALTSPPVSAAFLNRRGLPAPAAPVAPTAMRAASIAEKKWDIRDTYSVKHDATYYAKCMIGGSLACGLTHAAVTPLDVTKCNMQVNPGKYTGLVSGMRTIVAEEGAAAVWKGWFPTLIGYSMQGLFKFGLYEYFKDFYSNVAGEENAVKYKGLIWCLGSASAEFFADIALCPMEMVKVKVQTAPPGTWPIAFGPALAKMSAQSAETRFPFGSVVPLWSRQIPYTVAKFYFFEKAVSFFYTNVFTEPRESYSKGTQLGITFASGYSAGVICAIVSHPADSLVSQLGKAENKGKSIGTIASDVGLKNLMLRGLPTRIIMIGTLTGLQWYIYDRYAACAMFPRVPLPSIFFPFLTFAFLSNLSVLTYSFLFVVPVTSHSLVLALVVASRPGNSLPYSDCGDDDGAHCALALAAGSVDLTRSGPHSTPLVSIVLCIFVFRVFFWFWESHAEHHVMMLQQNKSMAFSRRLRCLANEDFRVQSALKRNADVCTSRLRALIIAMEPLTGL